MTAPNNRERILPRLIDDEIKESFINYSMSVIVSRALPDVRDGLKPVHRRVLYAMNDLGLVPGRPYKKCATVVGDVLGKYHPHGDSSVYDALVRMVQDFSLRYPLIDGQGNFGSVEGDPAAARRFGDDLVYRPFRLSVNGNVLVWRGMLEPDAERRCRAGGTRSDVVPPAHACTGDYRQDQDDGGRAPEGKPPYAAGIHRGAAIVGQQCPFFGLIGRSGAEL